MTLAAIDWLSISINLLLVVFVIVCLLMTLMILMQRPKQEGLGAAFGGGVTDQVFGARTTNVLQRGTVYCGTLFFVLALVLAILIGHQNKGSGLLKEGKPAAEETGTDAAGEDASEPGADVKPDPQDLPSSLLDELPDEKPKPDAESTEDTEAPDAGDEETSAGEETPSAEEAKPEEAAPESEEATEE